MSQMGRVPARKYTVRLLYLQPLQPTRVRATRGASSRTGASPNALLYRPSPLTDNAGDSASRDPAPRHHRQFMLPPNIRVQPVKQTLVQPDLPNIQLKNDFAIPAVLLWSQKQPPPFQARKFVAPPLKLKQIPRVKQSMPLAPELNPPNGEVAIADLQIANMMTSKMPRLPRPAATTSPAHTAGIEPAPQISQVVMPDPNQANLANVISAPDVPVRSSNIVALPPVNQVGPSGGADSGSAIKGGAMRSGIDGTGAHGNAAGLLASGNGATAGHGDSAGSGAGAEPPALASGSGSAGGVGAGGAGVGVGAHGVNGSATNGGAGGSGIVPDFDATQMTKINLPKDGKFGVVILGSEPAEPYPESAGALAGKIVYTVYLRVGLRKNWILQYCLPKGSESPKNSHSMTRPAGTQTPLDPPYPFLIMRPNNMAEQDTDYVLIHGMVTAEGKFDQLSLLFPEDIDQKQLLFSSLELWAFRPARRDGEYTAVEVLLIIPRQS